jgi:iron complex transport system substrate-binding protein
MGRRLACFWLVGVLVCGLTTPSWSADRHRIVSLIPAVTEFLFAIGAGDDVVGVSNYDRVPDAVRTRRRVGGLLDPSTETILALRPTLAVVYETQANLRTALEASGIRVLLYRHNSIASLSDTIAALGEATGRRREALALWTAMDREFSAIQSRTAKLPRPRVLFVVGRQPGTLNGLYVAGGQGFLHEVVQLAGGDNVFADIHRASAQISVEEVIVHRPDVIMEVWTGRRFTSDEARHERELWNRLPAVPAVRTNRVYEISDERPVVPGPRLPQGIRLLAKLLHPNVEGL